MNVGQVVHIVAPNPIPEPYSSFVPIWLDWVALVNGSDAILERFSQMATLDSITPNNAVNGWFIKINIDPRDPTITKWLPTGWLHLKCNCDSHTLFCFGCQCQKNKKSNP